MKSGFINRLFLAVFFSFGLISNSFSQTVVANFSGNGAKNTRPFSVEKGWEIKWNAKGDIFQLYLYDMNGNILGVPANQMKEGSGSSYQTDAGKFYLQVNALDSWEIEISQNVSGNNDKELKSGIIAKFKGNGGKNTRPFKVEKAWEIFWKSSGDIFQIYLYDGNGNLIGVPANQMNGGSDTSFQPLKGEYYLQVNALSTWEIEIRYID